MEIGRLFVEAQRFSEDSLSKLERQIHEVLCAAEDKAKQILTEATEEALEIRRQAQEAAFVSTRTARELQSAIAGFTTVNVELVKELGALSSMLTPVSERGMTELDSSSTVTERLNETI
jgi:cell division septum initiation protein DivIVA